MKKAILLVLVAILVHTNTLYSQTIDDLKFDLEHFWEYGFKSCMTKQRNHGTFSGYKQYTERITDFAISGEGYFVVYDEKRNQYFFTRNGYFHYDEKNRLVNQDNYFVLHDQSDFENREYEYIYKQQIIIEDNQKTGGINYGGLRDLSLEERRHFPFLIITTNDYASEDCIEIYISSNNYKVINQNVTYAFLERIPFDLNTIILQVIEYSDKKANTYSDIETLLYLVEKRFSEILKYGFLTKGESEKARSLIFSLKNLYWDLIVNE